MGSLDSVGMSAARLERVNPAMRGYVERGTYAGVSTLIARRGVIVHQAQHGLRDKEAGLPMTADTIFRLYSMTKPVICTALMTLLEEGRFRLVDPVARYIPAFGKTKVLRADGELEALARPIQVRDLMMHTCGLTYGFMSDNPVARLYDNGRLALASSTLAEAIDELAALPLAYQPGSRWHYGLGIDVAARLIEILSGQTLGEFLRERIFAPLGMEDTGFLVPEPKRARLAAMYGRSDVFTPAFTMADALNQWAAGFNERIDVSKTYPVDAAGTFERGGHGLFSTIGDYFRFAQMLLNGGEFEGARVIGRKTLSLMHSNFLPAALMPMELGGLPLVGVGFGLGSRVTTDVALTGAPGSVGEFGWSGAAKTYYWVDPVEKVVGIFMTQSMSSFDLPEFDLKALAYQAIVD